MAGLLRILGLCWLACVACAALARDPLDEPRFTAVGDTRSINDGVVTAQYLGVGASAYLVRAFSGPNDVAGQLGNATLTNFDNTGLPFSNGDITLGYQWAAATLAPGESFSAIIAFAVNMTVVPPTSTTTTSTVTTTSTTETTVTTTVTSTSTSLPPSTTTTSTVPSTTTTTAARCIRWCSATLPNCA